MNAPINEPSGCLSELNPIKFDAFDLDEKNPRRVNFFENFRAYESLVLTVAAMAWELTSGASWQVVVGTFAFGFLVAGLHSEVAMYAWSKIK